MPRHCDGFARKRQICLPVSQKNRGFIAKIDENPGPSNADIVDIALRPRTPTAKSPIQPISRSSGRSILRVDLAGECTLDPFVLADQTKAGTGKGGRFHCRDMICVTRASATGTRPRTAVPSDARQVPAPPRRRSENGAFEIPLTYSRVGSVNSQPGPAAAVIVFGS